MNDYNTKVVIMNDPKKLEQRKKDFAAMQQCSYYSKKNSWSKLEGGTAGTYLP